MAAAVQAVEDNKGFSNDELVNAILLLKGNPSAATSYLAISSQLACTKFLNMPLDS